MMTTRRKTSKHSRTRREPAAEQPRKKMGRPSIYSEELAAEICRRLAEGESLRSICRDPEMPSKPTVFDWLEQRKEFSTQYARARDRQFEHWADELVDIADDGRNDFIERQTRTGVKTIYNREAIERSRLRADTRKWILARRLPRKYGERLALENADEKPLALEVEERNALIDEICRLVEPKANGRTKPDARDGEERDRSRK